ncbi:MAG: hypothetical protein H7Z11_07945 [Verrucomicrobia bacterium]|nr:hypothetical protein [Leptolyngbya sp. ES-bin-22]
MAWIFSLSAECGGEQVAAVQFAQHFDTAAWMLSDGRQVLCQSEVFQDLDTNWWCRVFPSGISEVGINTPETAYLMTELGILLYQRLRSAPTFRYALVGVEVDEFRTYGELLEDSSTVAFPGLVMAETVWRVMGAAPAFRPFTFGYVWTLYEGEVYKPLLSSSALKRQLNELLLAG